MRFQIKPYVLRLCEICPDISGVACTPLELRQVAFVVEDRIVVVRDTHGAAFPANFRKIRYAKYLRRVSIVLLWWHLWHSHLRWHAHLRRHLWWLWLLLWLRLWRLNSRLRRMSSRSNSSGSWCFCSWGRIIRLKYFIK